ncbi:hypothetical protein ACFLYU_04360 [Candidatus Dependentiae bacterium]
MSKAKKLLILSGLLLCAVCAKAIDLKITNKYPKKVTLFYYIEGYGKDKIGWSEKVLKKNDTFTLSDLGEGSLQISKIEFLAEGFHAPGMYKLGKLLGKKWGGRRIIDVKALVKIKNKENKSPKLIEIELNKKEKKNKYKIAKITY